MIPTMLKEIVHIIRKEVWTFVCVNELTKAEEVIILSAETKRVGLNKLKVWLDNHPHLILKEPKKFVKVIRDKELAQALLICSIVDR